jgi:hypothetical protein
MTFNGLLRLRWPHGFRAALLAIPFTWVPLLLVLLVGQLWAHWPEPALRDLVLSLGAVVSFLPLLRVLTGPTAEPVEAPPPAISHDAAKCASPEHGRAVAPQSYDTFCERDVDPYLCKVIWSLTYKSKRFIVYLDEDLAVEWACVDHFDLTPEVGRVLNRVAEMMALPVTHLPFQERLAFRSLVAEAVARVVRDRPDSSTVNPSSAAPAPPSANVAEMTADAGAAHDALDKALSFYTARSAEISRWWYLTASVLAAGALLLVVLFLCLLRSLIEPLIGTSAFEVAMGAGAGGAGALLSVLIGSRNYTPDTSTRRDIHWFQGAARILAGTLGAVVVALAIKGNLVLGQVAPTAHTQEIFLFLCMIAGWSERLVPNLIERFEATQAAPAVGSRPTR